MQALERVTSPNYSLDLGKRGSLRPSPGTRAVPVSIDGFGPSVAEWPRQSPDATQGPLPFAWVEFDPLPPPGFSQQSSRETFPLAVSAVCPEILGDFRLSRLSRLCLMPAPPPIFDLSRCDDPRDLIHDAVQRLFQGEILGLPTETQYVAAAYLLSPAATRLAQLSREWSAEPPVLAVKSAAEALDYLPRASPLGRKLLRRFWPGPVTLRFHPPAIGGLTQALPLEIAHSLETSRSLGFRLAGHDVLHAILRLLPAPLLLTGERPVEGTADSASKLADQAGAACSILLDAGDLRYTLPTSVVHVDDTSWSLHRESVVPARTLHRLAGNLYLFVCTGNTCRSPMAEVLFRRLLSERQHCSEDELVDRGFVVTSAGVAAGVGQPASDESIEQMRLRGIDLRSHESQPLTAELLAQADRVFTMTRGHRELVVRQFPHLAERVELLARDGGDVVDPIGGGPDDYRRCAEQIEANLRRLLDEFPSES